MTPAQVLPHLLKLNMAMLKESPKNPNTASPHYHPNARCAYHFENPGHDTNNCWALKNKIQDLIDAKEVEFEGPKKPNVISAPMPKHGHNANAIEEDSEEDGSLEDWIFPTVGGGLCNWEAKDFIPITFIPR